MSACVFSLVIHERETALALTTIKRCQICSILCTHGNCCPIQLTGSNSITTTWSWAWALCYSWILVLVFLSKAEFRKDTPEASICLLQCVFTMSFGVPWYHITASYHHVRDASFQGRQLKIQGAFDTLTFSYGPRAVSYHLKWLPCTGSWFSCGGRGRAG